MSFYEVRAKIGAGADRRFDFPYPFALEPGDSIYDSGTVYKVVSLSPDMTGSHDAVVNAIRSHSFRA
jgi:hypothetical protein